MEARPRGGGAPSGAEKRVILAPRHAEGAFLADPSRASQAVFYEYADLSIAQRVRLKLGLHDPAARVRAKFRWPADAPLARVEGLWIAPEVMIDAAEARCLLSHLPQLRRVYWQRTGLDGMPVSVFEATGIIVSPSRDLTSDWVAETIVALVVAHAKRLPELISRRTRGRAVTARPFGGLRATIVGTGRIGTRTATLLSGLGFHITGLSRSPQPGGPFDAVLPLATDLPRSASDADYLILAVPLTPETRHLVGRAELAAMKPGAVLVNLARPGLCDLDALVNALWARRLRGACLSRLGDVTAATWMKASLCRTLVLTRDSEAHVEGKTEAAYRQAMAFVDHG